MILLFQRYLTSFDSPANGTLYLHIESSVVLMWQSIRKPYILVWFWYWSRPRNCTRRTLPLGSIHFALALISPHIARNLWKKQHIKVLKRLLFILVLLAHLLFLDVQHLVLHLILLLVLLPTLLLALQEALHLVIFSIQLLLLAWILWMLIYQQNPTRLCFRTAVTAVLPSLKRSAAL